MSARAIEWAMPWLVAGDFEKPAHHEQLLLMTLAVVADEHGVLFPTWDVLARQADLSVDQLHGYLKRFEATGLLSVVRRPMNRGRASIHLNPDLRPCAPPGASPGGAHVCAI